MRFSSRNVRPSPPHCVVQHNPKETAYPSTFTHWQASYSLTLHRRQKERKGGGGRAEMDKREGGGRTRRSVGGRRQEMECSHSVSLSLPLLLPSSSLLGLWLLYSLVPPISPPVPSFRGRERGEIKCPEKYFNAFLSLSCQSGWRSQLHSTAVLLSFFSAISVRVAAGKLGGGGGDMASPALSPLSTFAKIACAGEVQQKKGGD